MLQLEQSYQMPLLADATTLRAFVCFSLLSFCMVEAIERTLHMLLSAQPAGVFGEIVTGTLRLGFGKHQEPKIGMGAGEAFPGGIAGGASGDFWQLPCDLCSLIPTPLCLV